MAFLFVDSFDHYTAMPPDAGSKWDAIYRSTHDISIGGSYGRFSTSGLRMQDNIGGLLKTWGSNKSTAYVGFAHKMIDNTVPREVVLVTVADALSNQVVCTFSGGTMYFRRTNWSGTSFYNCPVTINMNTWYFFEIMFTIHSSAGRVIVRQDGVQIGDSGVGGVNSQTTGNAYCNGLVLGSIQTGYADVDRYFDDIYVDDAQFQGDCRIIYRAPDGAGFYTQWDPSTGANWECVNENPPVTTDYVSTTVADEIDTYTMTDISETVGTIKAVVGNYYVQKTDAGARQLDMLTRLSSTDLLTGSPKSIPSSWGMLQFIQETKPGGGAWTVADTKDAEMGMKLEV